MNRRMFTPQRLRMGALNNANRDRLAVTRDLHHGVVRVDGDKHDQPVEGRAGAGAAEQASHQAEPSPNVGGSQ